MLRKAICPVPLSFSRMVSCRRGSKGRFSRAWSPVAAAVRRSPGAAIVAHRQRHHAVDLRVQPQGDPADVFVIRLGQSNVPRSPPQTAVPPRLPLLFPGRGLPPTGPAIPQVQLLAGAGHLVAHGALFVPQAPLRVVHQQPPGAVPLPAQVQVIPRVQASSSAPRGPRQLPGCPARRTPCWAGCRPRPSPRRARDSTVSRSARTGCGRRWLPRPGTARWRAGSRWVWSRTACGCVFFEKQHIPHAAGRPGKGPVAAHAHG